MLPFVQIFHRRVFANAGLDGVPAHLHNPDACRSMNCSSRQEMKFCLSRAEVAELVTKMKILTAESTPQ